MSGKKAQHYFSTSFAVMLQTNCTVFATFHGHVLELFFSFGFTVTYLYEMETPLPCSTLAVAAGWWECRQSRLALTKNGDNPSLPVTCRMFAPPSVINRAADELLGYAPKFVEAACELLGPYPFRRLDMLILPKCFACMGLKR